jgi:precorrin-6B methylase 2
MIDNATRERARLGEVRRRRAILLEKIGQTKLILERSMEMLKQIDEIIAQAEKRYEAASVERALSVRTVAGLD